MQLTPNYNLKKPEETDPIDILDLNDNADIIDAEFKKRPVASGGDVSEMTVKTLETTTTEFPVPVAGESTKTFLGKVKKFFEDTKNWMTGVCLIGQIVNNCVTNNAKLPLSAAQGKVLMDLYTVLNTKISWNISTDVITSSGTIPGIIQAKEVIIYPKHSVPIFFTRQSLNDTVPQHQNGCFILYSTGQRWGSASYDLDWNTGTLTVNTPYASNDWNSVESNKIVKIAYR